jgi:hypothetical protein
MTQAVRGLQFLAAALVFAISLAAPASGVESPPTFEQVVERLNSANPGLKTLIVDQTALVHWMGIFHFLLRTTVYAVRPVVYKVIVHEAPAILKPLGDSFYLVSSPDQVLADYRATSIRNSGDDTLVLELAAARPSVNPPGGAVVIDTKRWLVQEITLNYQWGQLKAQYHYTEIEQFLLPDTISVTLPRFPLSADLNYTNYRLNVAIDPAIFAQGPVPPPAPPRSASIARSIRAHRHVGPLMAEAAARVGK